MAFYREHAKTLSAVLALNTAKVTIEGEDQPVTGHFVTANFFSELGASARLGRLLDPEDEAGRTRSRWSSSAMAFGNVTSVRILESWARRST